MRKRIACFVLALCLLLGASPFACAVSVTDDDIIHAVLVIFRCKEGTYDSVNRNDNGALSIGKLQWHGVRALELVKEILAADPATARAKLGDSLYFEAANASRDAWNSRILNPAEGVAISALLATDLSHSIQDATGRRDIAAYIAHARNAGIQTAEAIVYYCDLENQYGPGGAGSLVERVKLMLGSTTIDTLEEFHTTLLEVTANYHSRRIWTYEYCRSLDWSSVGTLPSAAPTYVPPANLDLMPPEILETRVEYLNNGAFRLLLRATDNQGVTDCRVEVSSDVESDREWAGYAAQSGDTWSLSVRTGCFDLAASHYYITATVSDAEGNGTSTLLQVDRDELFAARLPACTAPEGHSFVFVREDTASCTAAAYRVEQCIFCDALRETLLSPALGHSYRCTFVQPTCIEPGALVYTCETCAVTTRVPRGTTTAHRWVWWEEGGLELCDWCAIPREAP